MFAALLLEFDYWNFPGAWVLGFGAFPRKADLLNTAKTTRQSEILI